jgi:hypothetical protein
VKACYIMCMSTKSALENACLDHGYFAFKIGQQIAITLPPANPVEEEAMYQLIMGNIGKPKCDLVKKYAANEKNAIAWLKENARFHLHAIRGSASWIVKRYLGPCTAGADCEGDCG